MSVVRVEGVEGVVRALDAVAEYVADPADALDQVAEAGVEAVRAHTPVRTRALSNSVRKARAKAEATVLVGGGSVTYAPPVNSGVPSRNIAPARFIEKGTRDLEPRAVQLVEDGINRKIRQQGLD